MSVEENKRVARKYHDLKPDEVEEILTPDFIGRHTFDHTWNRKSHKQHWSREDRRDFRDTIHKQIADGEWVATRFTRSGTYKGEHRELEMTVGRRQCSNPDRHQIVVAGTR